jgi:hypothetical protein
MPPGTSGLERDLNLVRRRAWLFIPFAILGIAVGLFVGRATGDSNAVASMTLDTTVHDLVAGGDRGLRIFEAQEMTNDPKFKEKVLAAIGEEGFEYSRFVVSLAPISVADGISRGILTVSITDPDKETAERYRQSFVDVYTQEYMDPDGLFRTRYVDRRAKTAKDADVALAESLTMLEAEAEQKGLLLDIFLDTRGQNAPSGIAYEAQLLLRRELAEVNGALANIGSLSAGAAASIAASVIEQPVAAGDAGAVLTAKKASLEAAIMEFSSSTSTIAETSLDPETLFLLDLARGRRQVKDESYIRLANAQVAVDSAESNIETSYSFSGGLAGSTLGRVAVAIVITIVFGLIAIYTVEWLSQARGTSSEA